MEVKCFIYIAIFIEKEGNEQGPGSSGRAPA
jgi:hypothetical protein